MARYTTEFVGTFFLVLIIALTVTQGFAEAPLAIGVGLTALVYMGGPVSGAHYNPAVTLRMWLLAIALAGSAGCGNEAPPLDLVPSGELAGSVIATDQGRVPTTTLTLTTDSGAGRTARTDAGGTYFFSAVPEGTWTVTVLPPTAFEVAPGEAGSKTVTIVAGSLTEEDFLLAPLVR